MEFETKPLRPRKPKDSAVKRKPGNQGDEEFGDDDIHYHGMNQWVFLIVGNVCLKLSLKLKLTFWSL